jgi:hypothetical protein
VPTKTEAGKPLVIGMGASPVVAHGRYWFRQKDGRVFSYNAGGGVGAGVGAAHSEATALAAVNKRMRLHSGAAASTHQPRAGAGQSSLPVDNGDGTYTCPDGAVITAGSVSDAVGACQQEASGGGGGGASLATLASNAISALNADINNYCADVAVPGSAVNSAVHAFKAAWNAANPGAPVPINTGNYEPSVAAALNSLSAGAPPGCSGGQPAPPGPPGPPGPSGPTGAPAASSNLLILGGAAAAAVAIVGGAWWLKKHKGKRVVVHHRGLRRRRRR